MTDKVVKMLMEADPALDPMLREHLDDMSVSLDNAPAQALSGAAVSLPIMSDLAIKVLRNRTRQPFITSDNPTIFYNQFLEHRNPRASNTGLSCKGLQIFLPLNPQLLLVFYDERVYWMGSRKLFVDVVACDDVFAFNVLQAAQASEHLYFNDEVSAEYVQSIVTRAMPFRRTETTRIMEPQLTADPGGGPGTLLHSQHVDIRTSLRLATIGLTDHARQYKLGSRLVQVRNPRLRSLHMQFLSEVDAGRFRPREFGKFLDWCDAMHDPRMDCWGESRWS
jgi:hypothetical protein